jgi:NMD protein affecting ribosome stability and mRNA decay
MKTSTPTRPPERRDRLLREQVHDTYKERGQLKEPTRCPGCGAVYHKGRWSWTAEVDDQATETLCSACQRTADKYPAGEVTLEGKFAIQHKDEILNLVRKIEATENKDHPMNRIIEIRELGDQLILTTTDTHLPRRIGKAVQAAWKGNLEIHFDDGGYFTRIAWRRDE